MMEISDRVFRAVEWLRHPAAPTWDELLPCSQTMESLEALSPPEAIEQVAELDDVLVRNELITHNYWRIASRFYRRLGESNLVWPTFGSWASAQAGLYMRLGVARPTRLCTGGFGPRVTDLLGQGNQLIFRDIAPPFWRFLNFVEAHEEPHLRAFVGGTDFFAELAGTLALDPRSLAESPEGEQLMVLAFEQYLRALLEPDDDARAERIFVANACVGLQEQSRVDCMLDRLLDLAEINRHVRTLMRPLRPGAHAGRRAVSRVWPRVAHALGDNGRVAERRLGNFVRLLEALLDGRVTQVLGTQIFLELQLGADRYDLSDDIPAVQFARGLEKIELEAADFRRSFELVASWDRSPDSCEESAAVDWSELSDRMNFILDLFRGCQAQTRLAAHPLEASLTRQR